MAGCRVGKSGHSSNAEGSGHPVHHGHLTGERHEHGNRTCTAGKGIFAVVQLRLTVCTRLAQLPVHRSPFEEP